MPVGQRNYFEAGGRHVGCLEVGGIEAQMHDDTPGCDASALDLDGCRTFWVLKRAGFRPLLGPFTAESET
jgi:hypothetical protein